MVDVNRMTHKLQEALQQAGGLATRRNHQGIDVEHLLAALIDQDGGLARNPLERARPLAGRPPPTPRHARCTPGPRPSSTGSVSPPPPCWGSPPPRRASCVTPSSR